jgi:hypothetical protein
MKIRAVNWGLLLATGMLLVGGCDDYLSQGACSGDHPGSALGFDAANITIRFHGFDEHRGQLFKLRTIVFRDECDTKVLATPSSSFTVSAEALCDHPAQIEFCADVNGSGAYDPVDIEFPG